MFLWGGSPMLVALITFLVYTWTGNELRASTAFTALALFNVMRFPLNTLPMIINFVVEGRTALNRLCTYLLADEVDPKYYANYGKVSAMEMHRKSSPGKAILVRQGLFSWAKSTKEEKVAVKPGPQPKKSLIAKIFDKSKPVLADPEYVPTLKSIDFTVSPGELVIVCGPVGSGKSSLLGAILGDMKKDAGTVPALHPASPLDQDSFGAGLGRHLSGSSLCYGEGACPKRPHSRHVATHIHVPDAETRGRAAVYERMLHLTPCLEPSALKATPCTGRASWEGVVRLPAELDHQRHAQGQHSLRGALR